MKNVNKPTLCKVSSALLVNVINTKGKRTAWNMRAMWAVFHFMYTRLAR